MKFCILLIFFFPFHVSSSSMDEFQINLAVDRTQATLGEHITLTTTFKYPDGYRIDTDALIDQLLWTANPTAPQIIVREQNSAADHKTFILTLEPLQSGSRFITFLNVNFKPEKEGLKPVTLPSQVIRIKVQAAQPLPALTIADLHPLEPELPLGLTRNNRFNLMESQEVQLREANRNVNIIRHHSFPWLGVFLIALALITLLILKRFRDHLQEQSLAKIKANAAFLQAESNLEILKNKRLPQQGKYKDYFGDLKEIVLTYLEQCYHINWHSHTTNEIEKIISTNAKEIFFRNQLLSFMKLSDQVEFAGYLPNESECNEALATVEAAIKDAKRDRVSPD